MYNVGTEYMYIQKTTTIGKMYNDLAELQLKREIHKLPYSYTYRRSQYNETFDLTWSSSAIGPNPGFFRASLALERPHM